MPLYFFTIRWPDHQDVDENGTLLENDAAALDHACRVVRELQARGGYDNPGLVLQVKSRTAANGAFDPLLGGLRLRSDPETR